MLRHSRSVLVCIFFKLHDVFSTNCQHKRMSAYTGFIRDNKHYIVSFVIFFVYSLYDFLAKRLTHATWFTFHRPWRVLALQMVPATGALIQRSGNLDS